MNNFHIIDVLKEGLEMNTTHDVGYPITRLTVRRLHIDLSQGFARHWNDNDAFKTSFANALSMSFPVGEQFFIDAVKNGLLHLSPLSENIDLREGIQKFIGQEATHRHLHEVYNTQLKKQGYRNIWQQRLEIRIVKERERMEREGIPQIYLHELAMTCAVEHFTAILGEIVLSRQGQSNNWFFNAQEPMSTLWHWHAAEESEHKSMAFDLYARLGGTYAMRMHWYRRFVVFFCADLPLQIVYNLWCDGSWKQLSTWQSGIRFLLGRDGLLRSTFPQLWDYRRQSFHPHQQGDGQLAQDWLAENQVHWSVVR